MFRFDELDDGDEPIHFAVYEDDRYIGCARHFRETDRWHAVGYAGSELKSQMFISKRGAALWLSCLNRPYKPTR